MRIYVRTSKIRISILTDSADAAISPGAFIFFGGTISLAHRIKRGYKTWKHWKHQKQCVDEFLRDSQGGGGKTLDISVDGVTS